MEVEKIVQQYRFKMNVTLGFLAFLFLMYSFARSEINIKPLAEVCSFIESHIEQIQIIKKIDFCKGPYLPFTSQKLGNDIVKLIVNFHGSVIKIWSPHYPRNPYFEKAIELGFFEGISVPIAYYIELEGHILGYASNYYNSGEAVIAADKRVNQEDRQWYRRISKENLANPKFVSFLKKIVKNSLLTGLLYYDFTVDNIAADQNGNFYLIDLESIMLFKKSVVEVVSYQNPPFYRNALLCKPIVES